MFFPRALQHRDREKVLGPRLFTAAALLVAAALAAVGLLAVRSTVAALAALDHLDEVGAKAHELERLAVDLETGMRGFVVTGDRTFLEPRTAASQVLDAKLSAFETLVADDEPAQRERARRLRGEIGQSREFGDHVVAVRAASGDAGALVASKAGKRSMDRLRATFSEIDAAAAAEHERHSGAFLSSTWSPVALVAGVLVLGALSQALLATAFASTRTRERLALERARHAVELEREKRWLETVLEQSPAGIAIAEAPSGRILYRNPTLAAWQGGAPVPPGPGAYALLKAERPDGTRLESREYPIARALRGESVLEELVWRRPDGSRLPAQMSASPVRDETGAIVGAVAVGQDMTERDRHEATLRESERREREARAQAERDAALLDSFLAASPIGACVLDRDCRYVRCNDSLARIVGLSARDLTGRLVRDVIAEPSLRETIETFHRRVLESGQALVGLELTSKALPGDPKEWTWLVTYYPIESADGIVSSVGVIAQDVTAARRAQQALGESERREREAREALERSTAFVEAFLEASPAAVAILSRDLVYQRVNGAYTRMLQRDPAHVVGRSVRDVVGPELRERAEGLLRRVVESGEPAVGVELRGRPSAGDPEPRDWLVNVSPLKRADGTVIGIGSISLDITARKRVEEALRASEQREREARREAERAVALLDTLLAASPVAITLVDRDFRYVRVNAALAAIHGLDPEAMIGRTVREVHTPELAEPVERALRTVLETGEPLAGVEVRGTTHGTGDEPHDWLVTFYPVRIGGQVLRVGAIIQDITERKRGERALAESEHRERVARAEAERLAAQLDAFLAVSPVGFAMIDRDLRYVRVNDALAAINGVPAEAHLGRRPGEILEPPIAAIAEPLLRRVLESGAPVEGLELVGKTPASERERCWISTYYPVKTRTGAVVGVGGVVQEITERKDAENALRASEQRERAAREEAERVTALLDAVFAGSPVGFGFVDADMRFARVNGALARLNGVPRDAHIGHTVGEVVPAWLAPLVEESVRRVLETGQPLEAVERNGKIDGLGGERCWLSTYSPVRVGEGPVTGVGLVVYDITERKRAEEERERLLESERAARQEAERATRLRDEFLAIVSHDLRSPLAAIMLSASGLAIEEATQDEARLTGKRIRDAARRMDRMIQDLLDVARVDTGRLRVEPEPGSAADLLRAVYDAHAPLAAAASLRLQVEAPDPTLEGRFDRDRTLQVLSNLVGNAIKFTPSGGSVAVRCEAREEELVFSVADTGPGMSRDHVVRVFERFWQARRGGAGGLGLGLYIAKGLVEAQGGRIWVEAKEGAGTTFSFTLPRRTGSRSAPTPPV